MIFKYFIIHQIKETLRSSFWQKQLILNIIIGLFLLLMMTYLVFLGIFIDKLLIEFFPDKDPIVVFNGMILYYLGLEFIIRFFIQSLPVLNIENYLQLPVKTSSIVHFVAGKSIFTIGNFLAIKGLDLSKNASFNYQGLGAMHCLSQLPAFALPILLFLPSKYFGVPLIGYILIGVVGLTGLLLNKTILELLTRQFMKRRHAMANGFRS